MKSEFLEPIFYLILLIKYVIIKMQTTFVKKRRNLKTRNKIGRATLTMVGSSPTRIQD